VGIQTSGEATVWHLGEKEVDLGRELQAGLGRGVEGRHSPLVSEEHCQPGQLPIAPPGGRAQQPSI
jgi:hypothetical protein